MLQIDTNNQILIDGKRTGFSVHQTPIETAVVCHATGAPVWCPMPSRRYALSHDNPASNAQGRAQFERDFLLMIGV
jgi:hypothetical protein